MSIEKKIFAAKKGENVFLEKRWYVRIKVLDFKKGCFTWRKLYADINKYKTAEERDLECSKIILEIENTGQYITNQGSRDIVENKGDRFYADVIFQFYQCLEYRKIQLRPHTYSKYKGQIKMFEIYLQRNNYAHLPLGKLSNDVAQDFLQKIVLEKKLAHNTYNSYLTLFRSFFTEFVKQKKVDVNPFEGIKKLTKNSTPPAYFNNELIQKIKAATTATDTQLWQFVQFIYYCFIRPKELRFLQIKHIQFDSQQIQIPGSISKNKKTAYVAIPTVLFNQIQGWELLDKEFYIFGNTNCPGNTQIAVNTMKNRHRKILNELKISAEYKLYGWKHTGAVNFTRAGGNLKDLQMQLRHHSLDQVNQYMRSMTAIESEFIKNNFPVI